MPDRDRRRLDDQWHIAKNIPVALLCGLGLQTMGFVWWMSDLNSTVRNQGVEIARIAIKVDSLTAQLQSASPQAAVSSVRLQSLESDVQALRIQVNENSRGRGR